MADLTTIIRQMEASGSFASIASNPLAQFGTPQRRFLGAEILPERLTFENSFRDSLVRYRSRIANDAPRYSPPQKKAGIGLSGYVDVVLGTQNVAWELNGREYDELVRRSAAGDDAGVREKLRQLVDLNVNRALINKTEVQRFEALINAQVTRTGDNGYSELIEYPDPAGHRVAAGGDWTDGTYDPFEEIFTQARLLNSKGSPAQMIVTSGDVATTLAANEKVAGRAGVVNVLADGTVRVNSNMSTTMDAINAQMKANNLPMIQVYDEFYYDDDGVLVPFLPAGTMLFIGRSSQPAAPVVFEGVSFPVSNPLGYTAIGRVAGRMEPGRKINTAEYINHPPRFEAEGIQESLPVILEPEAIAVIHTINTTPA